MCCRYRKRWHINTLTQKYKLIMIFVLPRDLSKNHTSSPKGFDLMMDILLE
jgi:Uri superfamily endonuclease